jgi:hypothetical protein
MYSFLKFYLVSIKLNVLRVLVIFYFSVCDMELDFRWKQFV